MIVLTPRPGGLPTAGPVSLRALSDPDGSLRRSPAVGPEGLFGPERPEADGDQREAGLWYGYWAWTRG